MTTKRVLSIDGGGIRGIIPSMVLAHIEKQTRVPARELFDLIVGTSTGGIIALGLSHPGSERPMKFAARRLVKLFEEQGPIIFDQSLWKKVRSIGGILEESYSHELLQSILEQHFGSSLMEQCLVPTMVTSYDIKNRKSVFIKSWVAKYSGILCSSAARATSAAPTFFRPAELTWDNATKSLIDGAIFINSPSVSAYAEACELFKNKSSIKVLSLGTGEVTDPVQNEAKTYRSNALIVMTLLDSIFDGVSKAADKQMTSFLGSNYLRLQTRLHDASDDIDDASKKNLNALKDAARDMIKQNWTAIERFFS